MLKKQLHKNIGYSLVEVLLAIVIFSVCFIAVIYGVLETQKITHSVTENCAAAQIAQSQIELIKSINYDAINYGSQINTNLYIPSEKRFEPLQSKTLPLLKNTKWGVIITPSGDASIPYKEVTVTVVWVSSVTTKERVYSLTTWVSPAIAKL